MTLLQDYAHDFTADVRQRGDEYQQGGAVNIIDRGPGFVEAEVEGTHLYRVTIDRKPGQQKTVYECTCPYFEDHGPCKHCWATVKEALHHGVLPGMEPAARGATAAAGAARRAGDGPRDDEGGGEDDGAGGGPNGSGHDAGDDPEADEDQAILDEAAATANGGRPPLLSRRPSIEELKRMSPAELMQALRYRDPRPPRPAARREAFGRDEGRPADEDRWKAQLSRLSEAMRSRPAAAPKPLAWPAGRRLLYVVDVSDAADAALTVTLMQETLKREGTYDKPRALRISQWQVQQLPDPVDRRIVQLLTGTGRSGYGAYFDVPLEEVFEVDESAYEDVLRMVCATGRCRARAADGSGLVPVAWDDGPPWEFCLRVKPSPGGRWLVLDGLLRRPVTRPGGDGGDAGANDAARGVEDVQDESDEDLLVDDLDEGLVEDEVSTSDAEDSGEAREGAGAVSPAGANGQPRVEGGDGESGASRFATPQAAAAPGEADDAAGAGATTGAGSIAGAGTDTSSGTDTGATATAEASAPEEQFETVPLSEPHLLLHGVGDGFAFVGRKVARLRHFDAFPLISALRAGEKISVPLNKQTELLTMLLKFPRLPRLQLPPDLEIAEVAPVPKPRLKLQSPGRGQNGGGAGPRDALVARVSFDYDGVVLDRSDSQAAVVINDGHTLLRRDGQREAMHLAELQALGFREETSYFNNVRDIRLPLNKLPKAVGELTRRGWTVEADGKLYRSAGQVTVAVSSGIDWFELHGDVTFDGGLRASLPKLLAALRKGESVVRLDDGTYGLLPEEWLKKYAGLAGLGEAEGDAIKFSSRQIGFLDALLSALPEARFDETFSKARDELMRFGGVEAVRPPDTFVGTLRQYQMEGLGWMAFLRKFGFGGILADDMGLGKAQPLDAKVLTPCGWVRMGDVRVGDEVINAQGGTSRVVGLYPQGEKEIFRVTFSDGSATECCDEHLWQVTTPVRKYQGRPPRVLPLGEIRQSLVDTSGNRRHFIPMVEPVRFAERELPLHPYLLGVLLGDGGIAHRVILSSADPELIAHAAGLLPDGVDVAYTGFGVDYRVRSTGGRGVVNAVASELRGLGLMGCRSEAKFVPECYKFASAGDRLELLRGLLDTDGHVRPVDNNVEFCTVSPRLAEDVRFLVQSLGGTARVRTKPTSGQLAYRMSVALPAGLVPFRLKRKADVYQPRAKYPPSRAVVSVEPVGRKPAQCIQVDAPDHLYVTDDFIVTHNTVQVLALLEARRRESGTPSANGVDVAKSQGVGRAAGAGESGNGDGHDAKGGDGHTNGALPSPTPQQPHHPTPPPARGPSLVVAPRSLVFNWKAEAEKFSPALRVLDHTAVDRVRSADHFRDFDLILTTYGTLRRDMSYFKDIRFDYAILDEAQAIKNASSESAKAARLVQADHRLALSGTPVQNHLGELWSLFDYLNPGMMGGVGVFRDLSADAANKDATARELLARSLRPFILRRTKEQVAKDLPEKLEQTIVCELDKDQRKLYDELRDHYRTSLLDRVAKEGMNKAKIMVLEALLRLRQAACHPGLIDKTRSAEPSAKLEVLMDHLAELVDEGHKVLVFSQFTTLLGIVRQRLDKDGTVYEYLDGRTKDRQERVERFQTDEACKLFLISLKAGGVGLNLTAAEYVFLLDPWWNPAVEAQAIDRAHRIGQTRRVFAYRLIAKDTVEEKVIQLQQSKKDLADAIINADNSLIRGLSREDLEMLLS